MLCLLLSNIKILYTPPSEVRVKILHLPLQELKGPRWSEEKKRTHLASIQNEIAALQALQDDPHVVRLINVFEDENFIHIVMEACQGGELVHTSGVQAYSEQQVGSCLQIISCMGGLQAICTCVDLKTVSNVQTVQTIMVWSLLKAVLDRGWYTAAMYAALKTGNCAFLLLFGDRALDLLCRSARLWPLCLVSSADVMQVDFFTVTSSPVSLLL